ncbi:serine/threonine-protein kinase HipA [Knoellia remsis]|uniref:Serine/threonine-protein kinase HipA n=1 Tax=Knoellia remsis TaxID=407159 RepID=A0A2T0TRW4_9MICO|nr:HipA domain-containing protein [Knoellia remsis]PRY48360.1 serine/threonine-protein kinase HipA [Knoellia remsis]
MDYLLGVSDISRQGNLRFARGSGPFLEVRDDVPKIVALPHLLSASDRVVDSEGDELSAVKVLLEAGSGSLGGARPKASVRGDDGVLLLAKFPHRDDDWDVMGWEKTMLDLAGRSGLRVPISQLARVGRRNVLLLQRFDRTTGDGRLGYISAMTLLGARDGDERDYEDIAESLSESGAAVNQDLTELFGRVVFNVAVHNTDDHLRNHGLLRRRGGWTLSPVFDVNPDPDPDRSRRTAILGAAEPGDEIPALLDFAQTCRMTRERAVEVIGRVVEVVRDWRDAVAVNGISRREQSRFAEVLDDRVRRLTDLTR